MAHANLVSDTHLSSAENTLVDRFGRQVTYLRLSVTDRCNFRCIYCMDEEMDFLPRSKILSIEEMLIVAEAFVDLGVTKIRLTGGEPLIRNGILELCERTSALPKLKELAITTNGVKLQTMADNLVSAGVSRINISLDSLKPDRFKKMTRTGNLEEVLKGIDSATKAQFQRIKINSVLMRDVNDDEILDLAQFALERGFDISFIEEMPLGNVASHTREETQCTSDWAATQLRRRFDLALSNQTTGGPSRYYSVAGFDGRIGFISPISNNFCATCNRVRMTTEGRLLLCLGNEHSVDLKEVLRKSGNSIDAVKTKIKQSMQLKPERHHFDPSSVDIVRFMNMTGG